jgi:hypothetical protein
MAPAESTGTGRFGWQDDGPGTVRIVQDTNQLAQLGGHCRYRRPSIGGYSLFWSSSVLFPRARQAGTESPRVFSVFGSVFHLPFHAAAAV